MIGPLRLAAGFFGDKLLIRRRVQQLVILRRIRELHLDDPCLMRSGVDLVRLVSSASRSLSVTVPLTGE